MIDNNTELASKRYNISRGIWITCGGVIGAAMKSFRAARPTRRPEKEDRARADLQTNE